MDYLINKDIKEPLIFVDAQPLGMQLKLKRTVEHLYLSDLVPILGISKTVLWEIESGKRIPSSQQRERIQKYVYNEIYKDGELHTVKENVE